MNSKSKWACRFSLRLLVGKGWAYLWTLTTPDAVDLAELSRRWRRLIWNGFPACVRVFEKHPGGHGYHVHFVSVQRIDVNELRPRAEAVGFGRINVARIPSNRVEYVAKYLTKQRAVPGVRLWGCVGFLGVPVKRLVVENERERIGKEPPRRPFTQVVWCVTGVEDAVHRIRLADTPAQEEVLRVSVSDAELRELQVDAMSGRFLGLGIYDGLRVVTRVVKDPVSGMQDGSTRLEHLVDTGHGVQVVTEWLGKNCDASTARPAAERGSVVKVNVRTVSRWRGQSYLGGTVAPLAGSFVEARGGQAL